MAETNRSTGAKRPPRTKTTESRPRRSKRTAPAVLSAPDRKPARISRRPAPVLVRQETASQPVQPRKRASNRRRYDVALSIPGAEVRLPSIPQVSVGWRLISGTLVIGLSALLYLLWTLPAFQVNVVEVNGLHRVSAEEVNTYLGLAGELVFAVDPGLVQADLTRAFPEMAAITVSVNLPAEIAVSVVEREPVLYWREDHEEAWIDADGVLFPVRGESSGLPLLHGDLPFITTILDDQPAPQRSIAPQFLADVLALKAYAPEGTAVMYEAESGLGWKDARGWEVYFGMSGSDQGEMDMKLRVYDALIERLDRERITPVFVSVEFVHAPYFRTER